MKNPIKLLEPNTAGRDFVIGDLHGSLSAFQNLLKNIAFDPTKDRMISVGDLVDRGPDSLGCLALLEEPWFHCVLANHEQMMLEAFEGGWMGTFWTQNGGRWGSEALEDWKESKRYHTNELDRRQPSASSERLWKLLELVRELPFLITVKRPDGKLFHVIHAELPPGHIVTDAELSSPGSLMRLVNVENDSGSFFLWGRHIFAQFYDSNLSNVAKIKRTIAYKFRQGGLFNDKLSHIISGHTIMQRPLTILGQTNIDTGAFASYTERRAWQALTCVELGSWSFYQATETEFRTVEPLTVNKDDIIAVGNTPLIDALNEGQP